MKKESHDHLQSAPDAHERLYKRTKLQKTWRSSRAVIGARMVSLSGANYEDVREKQRAAERLIKEAVAFERQNTNASLRALVVGDSSARGVGAEKPEVSVAGYLGAAVPDAHIDNIGQDGVVIGDLVKHFHPSPEKKYDVGIVHVGANNTVRFRMQSAAKLKKQLAIALQRVRSVARDVVVLSGGDSGNCPVFTGKFASMLHDRSGVIHDVLFSVSEQIGAIYVDLFEKRTPLPRQSDYYAEDGFHPNGLGYSKWFEAVMEEMLSQKVIT